MKDVRLIRIRVRILDIITFALIVPTLLMKRQCVKSTAVLALQSNKYILSRRFADLQIKAASGTFKS
ncbi:hypothetical protein D3C81_2178330 [compost metagenome]